MWEVQDLALIPSDNAIYQSDIKHIREWADQMATGLLVNSIWIMGSSLMAIRVEEHMPELSQMVL